MATCDTVRRCWATLPVAGVLLLLAVVLLFSPGHRRDDELLADAQRALEQALDFDSQLESAPDPAALLDQRDTAFATAAEGFATLLARARDLPEAHLGLATVAWHRDRDTAAAREHVEAVITRLGPLAAEQLAAVRPSGRSGAELLARALAERAGYLLEAPEAQGGEALARALDDARRARELDAQPRYDLLADSLERLRAAGPANLPLDVEQLQPVGY